MLCVIIFFTVATRTEKHTTFEVFFVFFAARHYSLRVDMTAAIHVAQNASQHREQRRQVLSSIALALSYARTLAVALPCTLGKSHSEDAASNDHELCVMQLHNHLHKRYALMRDVATTLETALPFAARTASRRTLRGITVLRDTLRTSIMHLARWRIEDGCHACSPALVRCCGSSAHGWDAIARAFTLEAIAFEYIGRRRRREMWNEMSFTERDLHELVHPRTGVLVCVRTPVHRWSEKMVITQVRAVSQRFNHLRGIAHRRLLRVALTKLLRQCELRAYALLYAGTFHTRLHVPPTQSDKGLLSGDFAGQITCTPANNCGMSNVSSSGTWCERMAWSLARCCTKVSNVIYVTHRLCRGRVRSFASMARACAPEQGDMHAAAAMFSRTAEHRMVDMLNADQLQAQIVDSLYPSVVGFDAPARKDTTSQDQSRDADIWSSAASIAPSAVRKWMTSYARVSRRALFIDSAMRRAVPDLYELGVVHTFEVATRRDGQNAAGFLPSFFVRVDEAQSCFSTMREMESLKAPIVVKVGASYAAAVPGRNITVACDSAAEAIVAWAYFMRASQWRIDRIDFSSLYEPIIENWCSGKEYEEETEVARA